MATIQGFLGQATIAGFAGSKFSNFQLNQTTKLFPTDGFGDGGHETGIPTTTVWSFNCIGYLDDTAAPLPVAAQNAATFTHTSYISACVFTYTTGKTVSGNFIITSVQMDRAETDTIQAYVLSGRSTGVVTVAW